MRSPLSLKLAFVLSLSIAASSSSPFIFLPRSNSSSPKPSSSHKAASDLLSLLGSRQQAARINPKEAQEFNACLRFLVPFSPNSSDEKFQKKSFGRWGLLNKKDYLRTEREENEMVWWPPAPVMELARLAVDSGGDVAAIQRALDPTMLPIPDVEGCKRDHCELTRTPYGWRFISEDLNSYIAFLFEIIVARGPSIGLNVSLNRYDLFHGHLFLATDSGRLGIFFWRKENFLILRVKTEGIYASETFWFHSKEYPAHNEKTFPYNMGYCQSGSNLKYDNSINLRNILWLAPLPSDTTKAWVVPGVLVVLDARPGGIIYKDLVPEYVDLVRTIYEDEFGEVAVDVNYINLANTDAANKIFIC